MKIKLNNKIKIDHEIELIHEVYDGELVQKGQWTYLLYHNSEEEKVILKFKENELLMTRFGQPQTSMRFLKSEPSIAKIPTPMGLQQLTTVTSFFTIDWPAQKITVHYDLLMSLENALPLASYELEVFWGN